MGQLRFVSAPVSGPLIHNGMKYQPVTYPDGKSSQGAFVEVPQVYPTPTIDPVDTIAQWLSPVGQEFYEKNNRAPRTTTISDQEIFVKFWSKQEIENYINEKITSDVIAQRKESLWILLFPNRENCREFDAWFSSKTLDGSEVQVDFYSQSQLTEMRGWAMSNVGNHRFGNQMVWRYENRIAVSKMPVKFQNHSDSVHFFLRWANVAPDDMGDSTSLV